MRIGMVLTAGSTRGNLDLAVRAEQAGFDSVYSVEFFNQHGYVVLGAIAASTERITIGTGIANAFTRSPVLHATAAMDLDELSGGRAVLGLGTGTKGMNQRWFGVPFSRPAARSKELIEVLHALFDAQGGGGFRFKGEFYDLSIPNFARAAAARPRIPILLAAVNRGMMTTAGAISDGLVGHPAASRKWHRDVTLPTLRAAEEAVGRQAGACPLIPYVMTSIQEDRELAVRDAKSQIGFYLTTKIYHNMLDILDMREVGEACAAALRTFDFDAMAAAVPDALVDEIAIACTPDEARDRLEQWNDLTEEPLLYAPGAGVPRGRLEANLAATLDIFGS